MTWARLDDGLFENTKFLGLSRAAKLLYIAGLVHCARQLTDGHIERGAVKIVRAMAGSGPKHAEELVGVGLWNVNGAGYVVHDFLEYNPSREQVLERRAKSQAAGRAGGLAKARADAKANGVANA